MLGQVIGSEGSAQGRLHWPLVRPSWFPGQMLISFSRSVSSPGKFIFLPGIHPTSSLATRETKNPYPGIEDGLFSSKNSSPALRRRYKKSLSPSCPDPQPQLTCSEVRNVSSQQNPNPSPPPTGLHSKGLSHGHFHNLKSMRVLGKGNLLLQPLSRPDISIFSIALSDQKQVRLLYPNAPVKVPVWNALGRGWMLRTERRAAPGPPRVPVQPAKRA